MQASIKLIVDYIHEKKGVWITPIPPYNPHQVMLCEYMANIAKDYFETKKQNNE